MNIDDKINLTAPRFNSRRIFNFFDNFRGDRLLAVGYIVLSYRTLKQ